MKVLLLDAPQAMLDERRLLGLDGRDEMWDGVLHMVPPAGGPHQRLGADLLAALHPLARSRGLQPHYESGLYRTEQDYRVPDQMYCRPETLSEHGADGAELVVEILSPADETYDKIHFYAALSVREMLIIHPEDHRIELLRLTGGQLVPVAADAEGAVESDVLGVTFRTEESTLRIGWAGGAVRI
ncbi:hypothetical protein BH20ACT5_BH20ACT5_02840 [soil metagenome]